MLSWSLQVRLCTGQYLKCCTQAACLLFLFLCASRTIHPASSTVQKSIFKTETCKLTLHIKFIFFSLQETLHAVCQTLLLVCQTNSLKERITAKQTGMTSWKSLGFYARHWFSSRQRKTREWRAHSRAEPQWSHGFPEQSPPFQSTPVEPEWLFPEHAAGS